MPRCYRLLLLLSLLALTFGAGCDGEDPVSQQPAPTDPSGVFRTELQSEGPAFDLPTQAGSDPSDPVPGPFLLRGRNLRYEAEAGVLAVDLTLVNRAEHAFAEPVVLTFLSLLPTGVEVRGADNGLTGPGASLTFSFADGDGRWSPGEESEMRTLHLAVDPGVSVGLVARVDTGMLPGGGTIGGIVFHDLDRDGQMGTEEPGLPGVELRLEDGAELLLHASTGEDGGYRFEDLPAGSYTVIRLPREDLEPTTPGAMQILLVEGEGGEVTDFLAASFGCVLRGPQDPLVLEVGDFVDATGRFEPQPPRLVAREITTQDDEEHEGETAEDETSFGELRGPVTELDRENHRLAVMGSWVAFDPAVLAEDAKPEDHPEESCHALTLEEVELGARVRARVALPLPGDPQADLAGIALKCWNGNPDKIQGPVEEITRGEDDRIVSVVVLRTLVELAPHQD